MTARLGLGLAALGRPAYIATGRGDDLGDTRDEQALERRTLEVLDRAWASGIRYFDAARSYGIAERFLGTWLRTRGPLDGVIIGSKWGYRYTGDWRMDAPVHEVKDHSLSAFERQWPETLRELGRAPDVYLVHSVTPESPVLTDSTLLDRLAALAAEGVRIGISTSGPRQGDVLEAALATPDSPFSAVQATWNLLERSAAPALQAAHDSGWLVVVKESFANGRLTARGDTPALRRIAEERGSTPEALALGAVLAQEWADIALTGAVTAEQVAENAEAVPVAVDAELDALRVEPIRYWADRSARSWS
ncbi:aldo/keto reductase [Herbiconiux sp. L3-i23]|uniref:aldo/keto reductase n=1 Tax=Herbiconiux sp. L3-i23 TaxID=2905871 RepID=UPI002073E07B|nr:aldo/keto reductase [Herbiconiux sp. L3-i23]